MRRVKPLTLIVWLLIRASTALARESQQGAITGYVSLFKNVYLREDMRFQFGVEAYNVFNHPQFEGVDSGIDSANFGRVTSARDPRVLQLRSKFTL